MDKEKKDLLTEEKITNISFFEEDVTNLEDQFNKSEKLYDEIHLVFDTVTKGIGGDYVQIKSVRDVAEIAKTLVTARSLCADILTKKHSVKKSISDTLSKRKGVDSDEDIINATARRIVSCIAENKQMEKINSDTTVKTSSKQNVSPSDKLRLDTIVKQQMKTGNIKMTNNDKLVNVSKYVDYKYNNKLNEIVAIDTRNGKMIKNFPKERLPSEKIDKIDHDKVMLNNGKNLDIISSLEYDDTYSED